MLIYIHGFNSSALSYKAGLLREHMAKLGLADCYACPELSHCPKQAMAQLEALITPQDPRGVTLVGSSLGGFYATSLVERFGARAVLVNPAVRPYELLAAYLGPQKNLYTGEAYELTPQHIADLRELELETITPSRYLLITASGDEVLDYRAGVDRYAGCEQIVVPGSDHGFRGFAAYLDTVVAFWQRGRV
ncbi:MAG: esterase [Burkholderiales bacterium]|nr:esterase [Burkholderiales bacterium]